MLTQKFLTASLIALILIGCFVGELFAATNPEYKCKTNSIESIESLKIKNAAQVYKNKPYKEGEYSLYRFEYSGVLVGYATLEVDQPKFIDGHWMQHFYAEAKTGDWYSFIYQAHDTLEAFSRASDFAISKFYITLEHSPPFSATKVEDKWLEFYQKECKVIEYVQKPNEPLVTKEYNFEYASKDTVGVMYYLRTLDFKVGEPQETIVYSSEKSWRLVATPVLIETITTPVGTFKANKIKLNTYVGKDLEQAGDVFIWLGSENTKPFLKLEGEVSFGSISLLLEEYRAE